MRVAHILALAIVACGVSTPASAQPQPPSSRLDAPAYQIEQVGPEAAAPAPQPPEAPKRESLLDLELGDRVIPQASLAPDTVRKLQRALVARGYDPGAADGVLGDQTRAAIKRYQSDHGWPATGNVTVRLVVALSGGDRYQSTAPEPGVQEEPGLAIGGSPLVREIQVELKQRGYDLPVNGTLDARTVQAIETYQSYFGLDPTGMPYGDLLAHIRGRFIPLDR